MFARTNVRDYGVLKKPQHGMGVFDLVLLFGLDAGE